MEAIRGKYYLIEIDKNVFYDFRGTRDDNVSIYIQFGNKHDLKTRRKAYGFICRKIKQLDGNIEFNQICVWDLNNGGGDMIKWIGKEPYSKTIVYRTNINRDYFENHFNTKREKRKSTLKKILK